MPIDVADLTPQALQVTLGLPPMNLPGAELRRVFMDLARFECETFVSTPDGGALLGNPRKLRQLVIAPSQRSLTWSIDLTTSQAIDAAAEVFTIVDSHLPVTTYASWQGSLTSHLPVRGELASAFLDRKLFSGRAAAFEVLGPDRVGTGIKVFLSGGQASLAIEPLLQRTDKLFIQYLAIQPVPLQIGSLRGLLAGFVRFYDHQIRDFIMDLFVEL
jgi:hypothetical protein